MNDLDLIARVCETAHGYLALGNESWRSQEAGFVRNRQTPRRFDANVVGLVRAASAPGIDALLTEIESAFAGFDHRMVMVDPLTPRAFETRLAMLDGYRTEHFLVQLLEGDLRAPAAAAEVREALSDADWEAYRALDEMWWRESGEAFFGPYDRDLHDEMMVSKRLKHPLTRSWLATVDGEPRGFFSSWPGENGVGMVEDLFVHAGYRHRGLATALLTRAVADARERGAGPVLLLSAISDTPKHMYAAMGFRPLYVARSWTKRGAASA